MRRCIGCHSSFPQDELVRFTVQNGEITPDRPKQASSGHTVPSGNDGRGFYLCNKKECLDMALKRKAFNRILQRNVGPEELQNVIDAIR